MHPLPECYSRSDRLTDPDRVAGAVETDEDQVGSPSFEVDQWDQDRNSVKNPVSAQDALGEEVTLIVKNDRALVPLTDQLSDYV